jgi:hypothetical protein
VRSEPTAVAGCFAAFGQCQIFKTALGNDSYRRLQHAFFGFFASRRVRPASLLI